MAHVEYILVNPDTGKPEHRGKEKLATVQAIANRAGLTLLTDPMEMDGADVPGARFDFEPYAHETAEDVPEEDEDGRETGKTRKQKRRTTMRGRWRVPGVLWHGIDANGNAVAKARGFEKKPMISPGAGLLWTSDPKPEPDRPELPMLYRGGRWVQPKVYLVTNAKGEEINRVVAFKKSDVKTAKGEKVEVAKE